MKISVVILIVVKTLISRAIRITLLQIIIVIILVIYPNNTVHTHDSNENSIRVLRWATIKTACINLI